jgi:hypothetical protein
MRRRWGKVVCGGMALITNQISRRALYAAVYHEH